MHTAAHLYAECDGIEFLRSACKLDMRFVPEDQVGLLSIIQWLCLSKPNEMIAHDSCMLATCKPLWFSHSHQPQPPSALGQGRWGRAGQFAATT